MAQGIRDAILTRTAKDEIWLANFRDVPKTCFGLVITDEALHIPKNRNSD